MGSYELRQHRCSPLRVHRALQDAPLPRPWAVVQKTVRRWLIKNAFEVPDPSQGANELGIPCTRADVVGGVRSCT